MTDPVSLFAGVWDVEEERLGYRHRRVALGPKLGAELLGTSLYELPTSERTWPYHWELGAEEWLIVVSGRPTLRVPAGERELDPGDVICFPEGEGGAHQVVNRARETALVLIVSTKPGVAIAGFPDSNKLYLSAPDRFEFVVRNEPVDYWEGEP